MSGSPSRGLGPLHTRLPPSPDSKAGAGLQISELSLNEGLTSSGVRRLQSVARFQAFHPQALACSKILSTYDDYDASQKGSSSGLSCLGAIAGPQGVALFRMSKPHVPLLILSHATNTAAANSISDLEFEPKESAADSLYLAASRGAGALIWDASGHCANPLIGRLGMDQGGITNPLDTTRITSMAWKKSNSSPLLVTTNFASLRVWDLRSPSKPTTKFSTSRKSASSSFVQVACADDDEIATIDAAGIVQIFDIRMNAGRIQSAVSSFAAHETAGVGVASFGKSRWLSWGLDAPMISAVVKIWTKRETSTNTTTGTDGMANKIKTPSRDYAMAAQCVKSNLACARVCSAPAENKFMALGHSFVQGDDGFGNEKSAGWWAELYRMEEEADDTFSLEEISIRTFGVEKEAAFTGGGATVGTDKATLVSVLGKRTTLGGLQAAELSLSNSRNVNGDESASILLCCLSDTGILSTHNVPEGIPQKLVQGHRSTTPTTPTKNKDNHDNFVRTAFVSTNQARVYPEDREGLSLNDAATFWGASKVGAQDTFMQSIEPTTESPKRKIDDTEQLRISRRRAEGDVMPFDMEVPVAYGFVAGGNTSNLKNGITDITTGGSVSATSMGGIVQEASATTTDPLKPISRVKKIETEKVPCPRLCGAIFGRGNGGLVIFQNGEVKKMWDWYHRTYVMKTSGGKSTNRHLEPVPTATTAGTSLSLSAGEFETPETRESSKYGPRTLKDLDNMVNAAKDAQWGETGSLGDSDSDDNIGNNFFEEESFGSNSSDDDDDDDEDQQSLKDAAAGVLSGEGYQEIQSFPVLKRKMQSLSGPSSDMLTPEVRLTRRLDKEMLGFQRFALAQEWELGPWTAPYEDVSISRIEEQKLDTPTSDAMIPTDLTSFQYTLKAAPKLTSVPVSGIPRTLSDGNIGKQYRQIYDPYASLSSRTNDSFRQMIKESGLQGSPGSVRPNMEESMKFFRKLFTQPQEGGSPGFSTMLSPPDRPHQQFFPRTRSTLSGNRNIDFRDIGRNEEKNSRTLRLSVHTLQSPIVDDDKSRKKSLIGIRIRCLHNAKVCQKVGETEKEGVWKLLAQTVDRQIDEGSAQSYNGWGGNGGGALGEGLIRNLLTYYEALGDSQMLATMVCVLGGGYRSELRGQARAIKAYQACLLPPDEEEKYDNYIRKYAELLYEWKLLTLRSELNKHLVRVPVSSMYATSSIDISGKINSKLTKTEGFERSAGIALVFQCPRCGDDTDLNSNFCTKCKDFAFRCSICDNAVRGLFTVCDLCGHGGHVDHITSWFSKNNECPTGCGCACTITTPSASNINDTVPHKPLLLSETEFLGL